MMPAVALLLLMSVAPPHGAGCASPEVLTSAPAFVECARAGTERYRDRSAAIRDGYRRIGRDFPAMGEHWIRVGLVFDGTFDASRPEVLNYVVIEGTPRLLGVGYAMPLLAGEAAPAGPAGPGAWHDHFRTVDDETLFPHHHASGSAKEGPRLAMMHAWIWAPNPQGMFAADNWAIPLLRLNLAVPAAFSVPAAKALSLAAGGREYVEAPLLQEAYAADHQASVRAALDAAVQQVTDHLRAHPSAALEPPGTARLETIWSELWAAMDATLPPEVALKLAALAIR